MKSLPGSTLLYWLTLGALAPLAEGAEPKPLPTGVRRLTYHGYPDCIELANATTRVVLCPEAGGRVLEYSWKGKHALYLSERTSGKPYRRGERASMSAGRFDIGPEQIVPRHSLLWSGRWRGVVLGPRAARLISGRDTATGVQIERTFRLAEQGSHLACTQLLRNISSIPQQWCHWSRTFAAGGGICLIPLTRPSRFPNGYVMYEDGQRINFRPVDKQIRVRDGFLEILGAPRFPKLGMDSYAGWFGYLTRNNLLFVKRFPADRDAVYTEVAGLTVSIWYPRNMPTVELEPIGPRQRMAPGKTASFTEDWYLMPFPFPRAGGQVDLQTLRKAVRPSAKALPAAGQPAK